MGADQIPPQGIEQLCRSYSDQLVRDKGLRSAWQEFVDDAEKLLSDGWRVVAFSPVSTTVARTPLHSLGVVYQRDKVIPSPKKTRKKTGDG